jgi:hypothetical protein
MPNTTTTCIYLRALRSLRLIPFLLMLLLVWSGLFWLRRRREAFVVALVRLNVVDFDSAYMVVEMAIASLLILIRNA